MLLVILTLVYKFVIAKRQNQEVLSCKIKKSQIRKSKAKDDQI